MRRPGHPPAHLGRPPAPEACAQIPLTNLWSLIEDQMLVAHPERVGDWVLRAPAQRGMSASSRASAAGSVTGRLQVNPSQT